MYYQSRKKLHENVARNNVLNKSTIFRLTAEFGDRGSVINRYKFSHTLTAHLIGTERQSMAQNPAPPPNYVAAIEYFFRDTNFFFLKDPYL